MGSDFFRASGLLSARGEGVVIFGYLRGALVCPGSIVLSAHGEGWPPSLGAGRSPSVLPLFYLGMGDGCAGARG